MVKTLEDVRRVLSTHGHSCKRIFDVCVVAQVPTRSFTNAAGTRSIDVRLVIDEKNACLTLDTPWAFDARQATHTEAMLACLLAAAGQSPLVKTLFDPADGEARLRVDCRIGPHGVDDAELVTTVGLIQAFADRWYPHVRNAMDTGVFDPTGPQRTPDDERLESLSRRCGGVNRIATLLRLRDRDAQRGHSAGNDPTVN